MRDVMRLKHLSYRTEEAYLSWVKRFILFRDKRHPKDMGAPEIRAFLSHLAVHDQVAASTQNSALRALLFLYRHVLRQPFPDLEDIERAKRPRRLPTVLTREEVQAVLAQLSSMPSLMARLLYGSGLRLKVVHEEDLAAGGGEVYLPYAFARKDPHAGTSWAWQYVFPAAGRSVDPRSGIEQRHHMSETVLQKAVKHALRRASIQKRGSCHTLRHVAT